MLADAVVELPAAEAVDVDHRRVLELHAGVLGEVGAAAQQPGHDVEHGVDDRGARLAGGERVFARLPRRELRLPAGEPALLVAGVELRGELRLRMVERGISLLPRLARRASARPGGAVVLEDVVGHREVLRRQAEDLLDRGDLVGAERAAVRLGGVGVLRRRVPDVAAQHQHARPAGLGHAGPQARLQRVEVVGDLAQLQHVPAVALEALPHVVAVGELGRTVDRDVVVVVHVHEAAQPEVAGERRGLVADTLLEVAVTAEHERVVVDDLLAEARPQVRLRQSDADPVGEALAERTGRDLDAGRVAVFRVAGGLRLPLPELAQVVEGQAEAGEVEERVEQHRRVPVGEHEAVAVGPGRVGGVVLHHPGPEDMGEGGQGHRRARVTGVRLLHRVHREAADDVDPALLEALFDVGRRHCAPSRAELTACSRQPTRSVARPRRSPARGGGMRRSS